MFLHESLLPFVTVYPTLDGHCDVKVFIALSCTKRLTRPDLQGLSINDQVSFVFSGVDYDSSVAWLLV